LLVVARSLLFDFERTTVFWLPSSGKQTNKDIEMCINNLLVSLSAMFLLVIGIECTMQDYSLDVDDILNDNLMPASLMLIESREQSEWRNLTTQKLDDEFQCITKERVRDDGSFPTALDSMRYHRQMINEFLCSKFVAEKILEDIQPQQQMLGRRLGGAAQATSPEIEYEKNNSLSHDDGRREGASRPPKMLFDEGSYQYKNWLAK
jgi:hypothetical protein